MKISSKRELMQIALNHSSDVGTAEPYSFLVHDTTLPSNKVQKESFGINF